MWLLFIYDFNTLTVKHSSNYETERSNKVRSSLIFLESFTFFNIRYSISEDVFPTSASKRLWKWTRRRFVSWLQIEDADATYALPTNIQIIPDKLQQLKINSVSNVDIECRLKISLLQHFFAKLTYRCWSVWWRFLRGGRQWWGSLGPSRLPWLEWIRRRSHEINLLLILKKTSNHEVGRNDRIKGNSPETYR